MSLIATLPPMTAPADTAASAPGDSAPVSPALVATAGWALPGLGYVLIGEKTRGVIIMVTILVMYLAGVLFAGIRIVDVPGFDKNGFQERIDERGQRTELGSAAWQRGQWMMVSSSAFTEIIAKPWYVGQFLVGPVNLLASIISVHEASLNVPMSHARIAEIGTLYTAVAGMLNLLAIIDSASRASPENQLAEEVPAEREQPA